MTFYEYMMKNYRHKDTPEGDLADDMYGDERFPRDLTGPKREQYKKIRGYLFMRMACRECLETFKECWDEYVAYERLMKGRG